MSRLIDRARIVGIALIVILLLTACGPAQAPTRPANPAAPTRVSAAPTTAPAQPTEAPVATEGPITGPTEVPATPEAAGHAVLAAFLGALHYGRYEEAAALYGGDYGYLQMYNPDLAVNDHAALLQRACEVNGFLCLEPIALEPVGREGDLLLYDVTFRAPDGSIFFMQTAGDASSRQTTFRLPVQLQGERVRPFGMPPFAS